MTTSRNVCNDNPTNHGSSLKRPRTLADTGTYDPVTSTPSECRAKRMKILKKKRTATTGISRLHPSLGT